MINLVSSDLYQDLIDEATLVRAAETVIQLAMIPGPVEVSVVIEDDEQLHELNQRFLGIDAPTDVLSFPADELDPDSGLRYLGDVIISYPRAAEQAALAGEAIQDELQLLVVHGVLHLLGHDHGTSTEKEKMWLEQQRALDSIGCKITRLPE